MKFDLLFPTIFSANLVKCLDVLMMRLNSFIVQAQRFGHSASRSLPALGVSKLRRPRVTKKLRGATARCREYR